MPLNRRKARFQRGRGSEGANSVSSDLIVVGKQRHFLGDRLRDRHPVKPVAVELRERFQSGEMRPANRQQIHTDSFHLLKNVSGDGGGKRESARTRLNRQFPDAGYAEPQLALRVRKNPAMRVLQTLVVCDRPEEHLGIDEISHLFLPRNRRPSNDARTSSGSGALNSSGTTKSPFANPRTRREGADASGASRTRGLPERMITMSSPAMARSSSRER
jgi:hypothetical protein